MNPKKEQKASSNLFFLPRQPARKHSSKVFGVKKVSWAENIAEISYLNQNTSAKANAHVHEGIGDPKTKGILKIKPQSQSLAKREIKFPSNKLNQEQNYKKSKIQNESKNKMTKVNSLRNKYGSLGKLFSSNSLLLHRYNILNRIN